MAPFILRVSGTGQSNPLTSCHPDDHLTYDEGETSLARRHHNSGTGHF